MTGAFYQVNYFNFPFYSICMSFTRKFDDDSSVRRKLECMTAPSCYAIMAPGNGSKPYYVEDPHIRMQAWAGNLRTNSSNVASSLRGLGVPLTHDCTDKTKTMVTGSAIDFPSVSGWVDETRSTHPVWWYRTVTRSTNQYLHINPQFNAHEKLWTSESTRDTARSAYEQNGACVLTPNK